MINDQMVNELAGWMSDLVSGLQNRLERFDSATGLQKVTPRKSDFFYLICNHKSEITQWIR